MVILVSTFISVYAVKKGIFDDSYYNVCMFDMDYIPNIQTKKICEFLRFSLSMAVFSHISFSSCSIACLSSFSNIFHRKYCFISV